jgi:hypothetical protein
MLHHNINISVETMSVYTKKITQKENKMKSMLSTVWQFMLDLGQASYAAHLARNGQTARAQAMYKK